MPAREKFEFAGHDGSTLAALLETPEGEPRATALFAHCFTCGKDSIAASRIARALVGHGIAVLRFDFTGLGNSDGDFANTNFSSNVDDLLAAAAALERAGRAPSLLVGHSLGGTAVLAAGGRLSGVRAVATIGAPASADHVAHHFAGSIDTIEREGEAEVSLAGRPFTIRKQFLEDIAKSTTEHIGRLDAALLVMHSPRDETVPIDEASRIFLAARHPRSFISLDGADHLLTRAADARYAAALVAAWAERYAGEATSSAGATAEADASAAGGGTGTRPRVGAGELRVVERDGRFLLDVYSDTHHWLADEPERVGGGDRGPDPYEHLLAAVGTCTAMTLRLYAKRKKLPLERVGITLRHGREHVEDCADCDETPRRIELIERDIELVGALDEDQRARLVEIAGRCPVHRTLEGELEVRTREVETS